MRVLFSGDRNWKDPRSVRDPLVALLGRYGSDLEVLVGDCPTGVDLFVAQVCAELGIRHRIFHANWDELGKFAGHVRNGAMISALPDAAIFYLRPGSKGTRNCLMQAEEAEVPLIRVWPNLDGLW